MTALIRIPSQLADRRHLVRHYYTIVLAAALLVSPASAQTGVAVPELSSIDTAVEAFMTKWNVPGGSVALTYQGRLVYARGFGMADVDANVPVEPSHVFRIASVSKSVTGAAIAKLIEDGLLTESAKVFGENGILTGARYDTLHDARLLDITISQLLHHTAGLGRLSTNHDPVFADLYVEGQMGFGLPHSPQDKIEYYVKTQTLARNPNTAYEYSNVGYLILGRVVEAVTGMTYEDYVKTTFFDPLGITTFRMGKSLLADQFDNEVHYYDHSGAPLVPSVFETNTNVPFPYGGMNVETFDAHGGWTASPTDLVRFLVAVDGFTTKPDLLSPASIQKMTTATPISGGYAFGWSVNNANNWWHVGSIPGSIAEWVRTGSGLTWALLFNTRPTNNQIHNDMDALMWNALSGVSTWPTHDLFTEPTSIDEEPDLGSDFYISTYPNPLSGHGAIQVSLSRGQAISVSIHDILGRKINSVYEGVLESGLHEIEISGADLSAGLYLVRAAGEASVVTRSISVMH